MHRMLQRILFGWLILLLPGAARLSPHVAAAAQEPQAQGAQGAQPQTPRFGERIEVREVLLDALVTDAQDHVIVGLGKSDFVVRENGRPVELTGVTFYSNRHLLEGSDVLAKKGISIDKVPEDRYFILFFDDQRVRATDIPTLLTQQVEAGRRAKEWVDHEVLPNDWVAVLGYDVKLKVYQDFTHDHAPLAGAIDDAVKGKDVENSWPSRVPAAGSGPSLIAGLPRGNELRTLTPTIYQALQQVGRAAGNIAARKNLVLFTNGFGTINPFGQYVPDPRYYPPTMQALNSNDVAVYAVDEMRAGGDHVMANAMNQIAADTGGRYIFNFTNFLTVLEQISTENNGYYLLSYRAEHPAGSTGFQDVTVTTTNPEFKVKTRKGYAWTPGDSTAATSYLTGPAGAAPPAR
jgi:VWFA-related protein